jgi:hypothetical protein
MDKFKTIFLRSLLNEAEETPIMPAEDETAFNAALDKGTPPEAFDVQGLGGESQSHYIETAKHWIHKLDQFAEELNGLNPNSLNTQLNEIDKEGSIFRGIVKDQSDDIVKVTEILKAMGEGIKGYIIGAKRQQAELQAQRTI